ncbi:MAG TPA: hypothetical protein VF880_20505 [Actinomycetes bacterium]|jgi:hypothetical protein
MQLETTGALTPGYGGWVLFEGRDFPVPVYARFGQATSGRLEIRELYVAGDDHLGAATLRQLPLAMMEALANQPGSRDRIVKNLGYPGPDLRRLAAHFTTRVINRRGDEHWVARSLWAQVEGSGEPQASMPRRKPWRSQVLPMPPVKLEVPSTVPYPDAFYKAVADAYRFLALASRRPAVELADANGVPPSTTRRWVKEARRRGLLAPGQKGRRG